jgi:hypothetical protein
MLAPSTPPFSDSNWDGESRRTRYVRVPVQPTWVNSLDRAAKRIEEYIKPGGTTVNAAFIDLDIGLWLLHES